MSTEPVPQGTKTARDCLAYLVDEIHTVVAATVDDGGLPVTCVIDMMDYDDGGLYFLTARGKNFYDRLVRRGYLALSGKKGADTMSCVAVSVRGRVKEVGPALLLRLFAKNPYMAQIYPNEESRRALTVFKLCEGAGEWFDLSKHPIERASFAFGDGAVGQGEKTAKRTGGAEDAGRVEKTASAWPEHGYFVTDTCTGCKACLAVCPQDCIDAGSVPVVIERAHCLHCGACRDVCPVEAIERR